MAIGHGSSLCEWSRDYTNTSASVGGSRRLVNFKLSKELHPHVSRVDFWAVAESGTRLIAIT